MNERVTANLMTNDGFDERAGAGGRERERERAGRGTEKYS